VYADMVVSFAGLRQDDDGPLGAQTGRRGGAGPVGGLLGGKDPTGRVFVFSPTQFLVSAGLGMCVPRARI